jgi:hypothetical protein
MAPWLDVKDTPCPSICAAPARGSTAGTCFCNCSMLEEARCSRSLTCVREGGSSLGVLVPDLWASVRLVKDDVGEEPGSAKLGVDLLRLWLSRSPVSWLRCCFAGRRLPSFGVPPELLVLMKRETRSRPGVPSCIVEFWLWLSDLEPCDSEVATADTFVTCGARL